MSRRVFGLEPIFSNYILVMMAIVGLVVFFTIVKVTPAAAYSLIAMAIAALVLLFMILKVMPIAAYAYPSARVRVMKGKMLGDNKLRELIESMDYRDIIGSFEGTTYERFVAGKKELAEIERGLALNLAHDYKAIRSMSPKKAEPFFRMLSARYDIENIKAIMASKETGLAVSEFFPGPLSESFLQKLIEASSLDETIELLKATDYKEIAESLEPNSSLKEYQRALDKFVYEELLKKRRIEEAARTAGVMQDSQFLKKVYGMRVDIMNLKMALRGVKSKLGLEKTKALMVKNGYFLTEKKLEAIAEASDVESAVNTLDGTPYFTAVSDSARESEKLGSLHPLEKALDEYYLDKIRSFYLQQPFGLTPIACYLALKEAEISNLRAILNGVKEGLPKEQIKSLVVGL